MLQKKSKQIETLEVNAMATNEPPLWFQTFLQAQQEQMAQFQQAIVAASNHHNTQVQEWNHENATNTSKSLWAARSEKLDGDTANSFHGDRAGKITVKFRNLIFSHWMSNKQIFDAAYLKKWRYTLNVLLMSRTLITVLLKRFLIRYKNIYVKGATLHSTE